MNSGFGRVTREMSLGVVRDQNSAFEFTPKPLFSFACSFILFTDAQLPTPHHERTCESPHSNLDPIKVIMKELQQMRQDMNDSRRDVTDQYVEHRGRSDHVDHVSPPTERGYGNHTSHDGGRHTTPVGGRHRGSSGRTYQRPHEIFQRNEAWHEVDIGVEQGGYPIRGQEHFGGYYGEQQGDKALDQIKWKVSSFKEESDPNEITFMLAPWSAKAPSIEKLLIIQGKEKMPGSFNFCGNIFLFDQVAKHSSANVNVLYSENLEDSEGSIALDYPMKSWGDSSIQARINQGNKLEEIGGESVGESDISPTLLEDSTLPRPIGLTLASPPLVKGFNGYEILNRGFPSEEVILGRCSFQSSTKSESTSKWYQSSFQLKINLIRLIMSTDGHLTTQSHQEGLARQFHSVARDVEELKKGKSSATLEQKVGDNLGGFN
ncbi:hypothetical protein M9H77_17725 [Catharanthus roseus]|uniref:Uncharacterized protein n=1 Tax=Catharanthus roseus TaxID=4058 RepID=A0ACC0B5G6_CATRO|nr:hypothetical protein M9H77_17725 [Catharanthus roseus]